MKEQTSTSGIQTTELHYPSGNTTDDDNMCSHELFRAFVIYITEYAPSLKGRRQKKVTGNNHLKIRAEASYERRGMHFDGGERAVMEKSLTQLLHASLVSLASHQAYPKDNSKAITSSGCDRQEPSLPSDADDDDDDHQSTSFMNEQEQRPTSN
jgi:hypothetical protein